MSTQWLQYDSLIIKGFVKYFTNSKTKTLPLCLCLLFKNKTMQIGKKSLSSFCAPISGTAGLPFKAKGKSFSFFYMNYLYQNQLSERMLRFCIKFYIKLAELGLWLGLQSPEHIFSIFFLWVMFLIWIIHSWETRLRMLALVFKMHLVCS